MSLATKRLSAGSDQQQPIHRGELKGRNPSYFGKSVGMATAASADSIFPVGMGTSSDIAEHWQDGVCLLEGRKAKKCCRPPFGCKNPQGTANPRVFPRVDAHRAVAAAYQGICTRPLCSALAQAARTPTFLLQNLPAFPAGSPAAQDQRRVTLVTAVGSNVREGQRVMQASLHTWGSTGAVGLLFQHLGAALQHAAQWSHPTRFGALGGFASSLLLTLSRQLQYCWFYSHLPTNQVSIWVLGLSCRNCKQP